MTTGDALNEERGSLFRGVNAGKNQSLFREVNERLKEVGAGDKSSAYEEDAICECANDECSERISISETEYADLRRHGTWFAVAPGEEHVFADVERVVERRDRYWVVEKLDQAAKVAKKLDPRARQTIE
jgi:hypothetical protein